MVAANLAATIYLLSKSVSVVRSPGAASAVVAVPDSPRDSACYSGATLSTYSTKHTTRNQRIFELGCPVLWDVGAAEELAHHVAVLAFRQCVVIGLPRSGFGEFNT